MIARLRRISQVAALNCILAGVALCNIGANLYCLQVPA